MPSLRETSYQDPEGRRHKVLLPENVPESEAAQGIPIGPPSLETLRLPLEVEVRLHNQLYDRGLFTARDVRVRPQDVMGALMAAFKVDKQRIMAIYRGELSVER